MAAWQVVAIVVTVVVAIAGLCTTIIINMLSNARNWGSVTTTLAGLVKMVDEIRIILAKHEAEYWKKEEAMRELGKIDQKIDKAHSRLDSFNEFCRQCSHGKENGG